MSEISYGEIELDCIRIGDLRSDLSYEEKRECLIRMIKSMAENDEEAFRIAAESAFHLHYCDHPDRDFDRWFSGLVESMESHAQKAHRHMSI